MSDATATVVETPAKTGESRVESTIKSAETAIESGDTSGVYRIARDQVDETVSRELGISKLDNPNAATVAGPEIVALKQADAEFQQRVDGVLGGLKTTLDGVVKPAPVAKIETPITDTVPEKDTSKDLEKHEEKVEEKQKEPAIPVEELKPEAATEVEDLAQGVGDFEKGLEKINIELEAEKKALEEFNGTHGQAHTPLEQAYLDALRGRVTALEFEKQSHEANDKSYEATAKLVELKQKADKAEGAYQAMYDGYMNQPVQPHPEKSIAEVAASSKQRTENSDEVIAAGVLHLDEEDENYEARQYEQYHPGTTFGQERERDVQAKPRPVVEASPMGVPQKPKGRIGKFIDGLKFWKYFGKNQP
jgi:hypothetical protein